MNKNAKQKKETGNPEHLKKESHSEKSVSSVLLILTLRFSLPPLSALAAEGGPCGANARRTLDDPGTLTISGSGATYDLHAFHGLL